MRSFSLEDLKPQSGALFDLITDSVKFLKSDGTFTTKAILASQLQDRIKYHTGLYIDPLIKKDLSMNAYVILPAIDKNHPFIQDKYRKWYMPKVGETFIELSKAAPKGAVNTSTGKVSGVFEEIKCDMFIAYDLIQGSKFKAEEIAAILLHEIGHLFTYYLHLGTTVQTALFSSAIAKHVIDATSFDEKVKVLTLSERTLGIEFPEKEALARLEGNKANTAIQAVILTTVAEKQKSESGTSLYEVRACEQIADGFAISHGAGKDLVTGLDKLGKMAHDDSHKSRAWFVLVQTTKFILFVIAIGLGGVGTAIPLLAGILMSNPWVTEYDKPEARIELIRKRLMHMLSDRSLTKEEKLDIEEDIVVIDKVKESVKDKDTLVELFWGNLMKQGRRAKRELEFAKTVEAMVHNESFREAAAFSILK